MKLVPTLGKMKQREMQNTVDDILEWLLKRISSILNLKTNRLSGQSKTDDLGLDSITRAGLLLEIERQYQCVIEQDALFDYPTLLALAQHIASMRQGRGNQ